MRILTFKPIKYMWIKKPSNELREQKSGIKNLNFVYKKENIYIMDNHLAAGWAWLQELAPNQSYNFFHIDRHRDLLMNAPIDKYEHLKGNKNITLDEYTSLAFKTSLPDYIYKVFQWDNYILQIKNLYPNWFIECFFATEEYVSDEYLNIVHNPGPFELYSNIDYWINGTYTERKWIVNLDLDYFFNDKGMILFSEQYIRAFAENLKKSMNNVAVLTIALSPECCGSWKNAFHILDIITQEIDMEINEEINQEINLTQ